MYVLNGVELGVSDEGFSSLLKELSKHPERSVLNDVTPTGIPMVDDGGGFFQRPPYLARWKELEHVLAQRRMTFEREGRQQFPPVPGQPKFPEEYGVLPGANEKP
ncbi:hypothetical protein [Humisphaera borealis]|uniref:Uncharacterized protein n=1 Tax=Humisphaera borealis TaxID=2807512 RepID=A0A7M2WR23_9BACT|nr:hypothetical protein [Humisphaera borealis]QOV87694.1 hypothetical protein IPV69_15520 [Humisphaera borealis]